MDRKQQIEKVAQILSDEELDKLASGEMSPATRKKIEKIAKWTLRGLTAAGAVTTAAIAIAALVGGATGRGPFGSLKREETELKNCANNNETPSGIPTRTFDNIVIEPEEGDNEEAYVYIVEK